jgi:hypothetical protein
VVGGRRAFENLQLSGLPPQQPASSFSTQDFSTMASDTTTSEAQSSAPDFERNGSEALRLAAQGWAVAICVGFWAAPTSLHIFTTISEDQSNAKF